VQEVSLDAEPEGMICGLDGGIPDQRRLAGYGAGVERRGGVWILVSDLTAGL
jgi:hypothetical protein